MARSPHDSHVEMRARPALPSARPRQRDEVPVLDLTAGGPLPSHIQQLLESGDPTWHAPPTAAPSRPAAQGKTGQPELWLEGGALMCACPDCQAPISVRVWLMMADCWQCGTSIELTRARAPGEASAGAAQPERLCRWPSRQVSRPSEAGRPSRPLPCRPPVSRPRGNVRARLPGPRRKGRSRRRPRRSATALRQAASPVPSGFSRRAPWRGRRVVPPPVARHAGWSTPRD